MPLTKRARGKAPASVRQRWTEPASQKERRYAKSLMDSPFMDGPAGPPSGPCKIELRRVSLSRRTRKGKLIPLGVRWIRPGRRRVSGRIR